MEQQAVGFTLQQGVAVVVLVCIAVVFGLAIRWLVTKAEQERSAAAARADAKDAAATAALKAAQDECREERKQDRAELAGHLDRLATAVDANTAATVRLADNIRPVRAA